MVCDKVRESGGEAFKFHCIIHQEALCAKTIQLRDVLEDVIKTVNVIKARGLFHKEFKEFLSELDAKYGDVVYHSAVCWLSRGNVLKRFYSLRSEINQFLKAKNQPFHELSNPLWLADLAFLVDLHDHLNTLNKRVQGKDQLMSDLYMEMQSLCTLLSIYESQLTNCEYNHFPTLLERTTSDPKTKIKSRMEKYVTVIKSLKAEFDRRFQD